MYTLYNTYEYIILFYIIIYIDKTYANAQITYSNFGWDDSDPETCSSPKLHRKNRHKSRPSCCNRKLQLNCYTDVLPEVFK